MHFITLVGSLLVFAAPFVVAALIIMGFIVLVIAGTFKLFGL